MALLLALVAVAARGPGGAEAQLFARPNVVVIMTDDQTMESVRVMSNARTLIAQQGASFPQSFASDPVCCPSRATFLTGQYMHNHGVRDNVPPQGGFPKLDSSNTLAVWLQRAGYYTGLIGKYLNWYGCDNPQPPGCLADPTFVPPVPAGYSEWHGSQDPHTYNYYGYRLVENGALVQYGLGSENPDDPAHPETYSTDVYTDKAVDFIARRAPQAQPFFLWVSYLAPHNGGPSAPGSRCQPIADQLNHTVAAPKPAARHIGAFENEPLPGSPSFNEADVSDKPRGIRDFRPLLTAKQAEHIHRAYRCMLETLLAVDEGVGRIIGELGARGELANTLVVFTSDNGFFYGEHRLPQEKRYAYEESIRVPLFMRGPQITRGVVVRDLVVNADLAPTILQLARASANRVMDGWSLIPYVRQPNALRKRQIVLEDISVNYVGLRNERYTYVLHWTGERELYDNVVDPYQLNNLDGVPRYAATEAALAQDLAALRSCSGAACRARARPISVSPPP